MKISQLFKVQILVKYKDKMRPREMWFKEGNT